MDYNYNKRYFNQYRPGVTGQIVLAIIGALVLKFFGNSDWKPFGLPIFNWKLFGVSLIVLGIAWIVISQIIYKKKFISDADYDRSVATNLVNIRDRALNKLGIDPDEVKEIEPIHFSSFRYAGCTRHKTGEDGYVRTDVYESVTLFFSQNEVHCYTYNFNTLENKEKESTDVYFYQDIVSVSTTSETATFEDSVSGKTQEINYEAFQLVTTGGTKLTVGIKDQETAQRSINAMRALLRAKKTQN